MLLTATGAVYFRASGRIFRHFCMDHQRQKTSSSASIDSEPLRIAYDVVGAPAFLVQYNSDLRVAQERAPDIQFHAMREHSGRVFGAAPTL
ncbi:MAG: hypothetical protein RL260_2239 [Pseudomonadota bacterium]